MEKLSLKPPEEKRIKGEIIKDDNNHPIGIAINDGSLDYATNEERSKIVATVITNVKNSTI